MRLLCVALALLALVLPAFGQNIEDRVVPRDANLRPVYQTFTTIGSDSLYCKVDNDTLQWVWSEIPNVSGWFNFSFVEEVKAQSARFCFKEVVYGSTLTYAWGDTVVYPIYGKAVRDAFQIGVCDSVKIAVVGTDANPDAVVECFTWVEGN